MSNGTVTLTLGDRVFPSLGPVEVPDNSMVMTSQGAVIHYKVTEAGAERIYDWYWECTPQKLNRMVVPADYEGNPLLKINFDFKPEAVCFECGGQAIERHHVVPRSMGGINTVWLCSRCHGLVHGIDRLNISTLVKSALSAKKARGEQLGTPANLTDEARAKGREAHRRRAASNQNTAAARGYAQALRNAGFTLRQVADTLNAEGFKTPRGGQFSAVQVARLNT